MEDFDRRRATQLVLNDGTKRLLSPTEINALRGAVLTTDMSLHGNRGVALAMISKAENGKVLSYAEADAVAQSIEKIWLKKPLGMGVQSGVRDPSATCHKCACNNCPECKACAFNVGEMGGHVRNSLSRPPTYAAVLNKPEDCGCDGK